MSALPIIRRDPDGRYRFSFPEHDARLSIGVLVYRPAEA